VLYLDSSALAKLYVAELGTDDVRVLVQAYRGRLFTSEFHESARFSSWVTSKTSSFTTTT